MDRNWMCDYFERRASIRAFSADMRRLQQRWSVLEHPFMRRWSEGRFSSDDLRHFAVSHSLAAGTLVDVAVAVAADVPRHWRDTLADHAAEKAAQLAIWYDALEGLDLAQHERVRPAAERCVSRWSLLAFGDPVAGLAVLYALEREHASTAPRVLQGLARNNEVCTFGLNAYWQRHVDGAHLRADVLRGFVDSLAGAGARGRAGDAAEAALASSWELLTELESAHDSVGH